jgi:hypothetical protein
MEVVRVNIVDNYMEYGENPILKTFYLVNPNQEALSTLKRMIEDRFDYQYDDNISDEEIEAAENFNDNIWNHIYDFVEEHFEQLDIIEYHIEY